ncbi:MAG: NAD-dependent epimerase/dehydratase family protein [Gemmatimonadota bacterium]
MPRILITGATGLVGSHAASLWSERGWRVRALVRPASDTSFLESLGCELVLGDLTDPASLRGSAGGCEVVLHAAAYLGIRAPWEGYRAPNVDGTRNILAESLHAGVRRFLHVSTVAVYGAPSQHDHLPIDEDTPTDLPVREDAYYERSKRMAEAVVRATPVSRLPWTILRPAVVVGERDRHFTRRIVELTRYGVLPVVGDGENPLPIVFAGNVAVALWLAAEREVAVGRTYNVTGDGRLTQRQLFSIAAGEKGQLRLVPLPPALLRGVGSVLEAAFAALGRHRRPRLNRARVWFLANPDPYDGGRIRRELEWNPTTSTVEGWTRSVAWYRQSRAKGRA